MKTTLALILGLLFTNQQSQAQIVEAAKLAYSAYESKQAEAAHQEILDAIDMVGEAILNELDNIQEREVESCAEAMQLNFENFLNQSRQSQENFSSDYLRCITLASNLISAKGPDRAEKLTKAFNVLISLTLFSYDHLGFTTNGLKNLIIKTNETALEKLEPRCSSWLFQDFGGRETWMHECFYADGSKGTALGIAHNDPYAKDEAFEAAIRDKGYDVAREILSLIQ